VSSCASAAPTVLFLAARDEGRPDSRTSVWLGSCTSTTAVSVVRLTAAERTWGCRGEGGDGKGGGVGGGGAGRKVREMNDRAEEEVCALARQPGWVAARPPPQFRTSLESEYHRETFILHMFEKWIQSWKGASQANTCNSRMFFTAAAHDPHDMPPTSSVTWALCPRPSLSTIGAESEAERGAPNRSELYPPNYPPIPSSSPTIPNPTPLLRPHPRE